MFTLQKAQRKQVKMRLNLSGPSGSGKTYSALLMAKGLVGNWSKVAVIDTENGSASLYAHLGDFNTISLTPPFSPERYIAAVDACVSGGIECIIIDSSSHEWNQLLEDNERLAVAKFRGNTWSAWSETTPRHDRFVQHVLHSPVHVITCTRSKTETVMGEDKKVKKVGIKDVQREGWEYELTVSLNIDRDTHFAIPSKDRTNIFEKMPPFLISEKTGQLIKEWCESGIAPVQEPAFKVVEVTEEAISQAIAALYLCTTLDDLDNWKKTTPEVLVKNKTVVMAATGQYNKIKGGSNE